MVKPICPSCHQEVPVGDVDLSTGLGRCRFCNEIFEITELVEHLKQVRAAQTGETHPPRAPQPADTRIRLVRKDDKLLIHFPRRGVWIGGIAILLFSLFWLGFVAFWTATALGLVFHPGAGPKLENVIFSLFSIPFWLIGFAMFGSGLVAMFSERIVYLDSAWLESRFRFGYIRRRKRIPRELVENARVAKTPFFRWEGQGKNSPTYGVEIVYKGGTVKLPCESEAEQNWLLGEVNDFLESVLPRPGYLSEGMVEENLEDLTQEG